MTNPRPQPEPTSVVMGIEMSNPGAIDDTRAPAHALALWRIGADGDALLGSAPMPRSTRGSDAVMAGIETLCAGCAVRPGQLTRVLVSLGPGGYTALRISTTTAKVLAMALGAELIGIETARVAAASIDPGRLPAMIALASRRQHTHATIAHADRTLEAVGVIGVDRLAALEVRTLVADAHLPPSFAQGARELGIERIPLVLDARTMLDASAGIAPVAPIALGPIYAREPDAVTQWRARHGG